MKILVIDDQPERVHPLMAAGYDVKVACGFQQINYWLDNEYWIPDVICLDHDMPHLDGLQVVKMFHQQIINTQAALFIWSWNPTGADNMKNLLKEYHPDKGVFVQFHNPITAAGICQELHLMNI